MFNSFFICILPQFYLTCRLAEYLKNRRGLDLRNQVCVITFYAGQVLCINKMVRSSGLAGDGLRVMTVDSFQGSECDVVILSFVRCNNNGIVGFVKDFQRLNVALTRAKFLLLCVGCAETLQSGTKSVNTANTETAKTTKTTKTTKITGITGITELTEITEIAKTTIVTSSQENPLPSIITDARHRGRFFLVSELNL